MIGVDIKRSKNQAIALALLFIVIGSLFICNKMDTFMSAESDGYFHALGAFFVYDFAKWWISSPTLSFELMKSFFIDYQVHYKFFGGIAYYQPFQSLFVGLLAFFSGKYPLTFYIGTAIETLATMWYAYKIYNLLYGKGKSAFVLLVPLFIAFNPVIFNYGASYSLEPAVMLFATMAVYYFISYMKTEKRKDLYMIGLSAGLGMLAKTPFLIVLPILLISIFLEGKRNLLFKNYKGLAMSFLILLLAISPWLISEHFFNAFGVSRIEQRLGAASFNLEPFVAERTLNIVKTTWVVFGAFLIIPFFLYKFLKSKRVPGEMTLLLFIILYSLFYNIVFNALPTIQPRYLTACVPFAIILSVRGMEIFHEKQKSLRKYLIPIIATILFTSALSCYNYSMQEKMDLGATDILSPAIYIADNSGTPTTVMSTFSRMQAYAFQIIDDRNISVVEAPYNNTGGLEEAILMLDSKDYVRRLHKPEWERFNMTHPPIGWVIVHEKFDGWETDYKLKEIIDKREDFELVQVMEGKWPGNRVFIYKRKPSFFY